MIIKHPKLSSLLQYTLLWINFKRIKKRNFAREKKKESLCMLSNSNLSFYISTKYSNKIIIISQEFSRDLEYTCYSYHQIHIRWQSTIYIFFHLDKSFFSFLINKFKRTYALTRLDDGHQPSKIQDAMPPTVISLYIFARLDSFSYEQIQRGRGAHKHAYNLSSWKNLYLSSNSVSNSVPDPTAVDSVNLSPFNTRQFALLTKLVASLWCKLPVKENESFAMRELFHSLFSAEVRWETRGESLNGEGREEGRWIKKRKERNDRGNELALRQFEDGLHRFLCKRRVELSKHP